MKIRLQLWALLILGLMGSASVNAASDWEVSRLAGDLERASLFLATEVKSMTGYHSVEHHARQISRKASILRDAIARNRTGAYISAKITDLTRSYNRLEKEYLRVSQRRGRPSLDVEFDQLVHLYVSLLRQYRGDRYYPDYNRRPGQRHSVLVPPASQAYDPSYHPVPPHSDNSQWVDPQHYYRYDHRSAVGERRRLENAQREERNVGNAGSYRLNQ